MNMSHQSNKGGYAMLLSIIIATAIIGFLFTRVYAPRVDETLPEGTKTGEVLTSTSSEKSMAKENLESARAIQEKVNAHNEATNDALSY